MSNNICLNLSQFSSILCDFPWLFPDFSSLFKIPWLFPDWKMPSHFSRFSRFSSPSGNPVLIICRCWIFFGQYCCKKHRVDKFWEDYDRNSTCSSLTLSSASFFCLSFSFSMEIVALRISSCSRAAFVNSRSSLWPQKIWGITFYGKNK